MHNLYQTHNETHNHVYQVPEGMTNSLQELIAFLRANQPSRPNEGVIPPVPPPQPMEVDESRRVRPRGGEAPMDSNPRPPPAPPGLGYGHIAPELIQTNRQILEQFRNLHEENRQAREAALAAEDRHVAATAAVARQSREQHEATMNMFRSALNPHAEAIAAMHAGAASLHGAAQDIRSSAAQHRQMAAESSDLFLAAMRQGMEAMRPGAQRPDEVPAAGPETSFNPTIDTTIVALDAGTKRENSPLTVTEARPAKLQKAAARAASRGAAAAASSSDAPATMEEARPAAGFRPKVGEKEEAARPYGVTIDAPRGRARERTRSVKVRQILLDELQPHDESGAVITGEPNATIRIASAPKQRIKSADRASPPPKKTPPPRSTREASRARTPQVVKARASRTPSLVRQLVA